MTKHFQNKNRSSEPDFNRRRGRPRSHSNSGSFMSDETQSGSNDNMRSFNNSGNFRSRRMQSDYNDYGDSFQDIGSFNEESTHDTSNIPSLLSSRTHALLPDPPNVRMNNFIPPQQNDNSLDHNRRGFNEELMPNIQNQNRPNIGFPHPSQHDDNSQNQTGRNFDRRSMPDMTNENGPPQHGDRPFNQNRGYMNSIPPGQNNQPPNIRFPFPSNVGLTPPLNIRMPPPTNVRLPPPTNVRLPPPANRFQPPSNAMFQPPSNTRFQPPSNAGFHPPSNVDLPPPSNIRFQQPPNVGFQQQSNVGFQQPSNVGYQQPSNTGLQPPSNLRFQQPSKIGLQPSSHVPMTHGGPPQYDNSMNQNRSFNIPSMANISNVGLSNYEPLNTSNQGVSQPPHVGMDHTASFPNDNAFNQNKAYNVRQIPSISNVQLPSLTDVQLPSLTDVQLPSLTDVQLSNPSLIELTKPSHDESTQPSHEELPTSSNADVSPSSIAVLPISTSAELPITLGDVSNASSNIAEALTKPTPITNLATIDRNLDSDSPKPIEANSHRDDSPSVTSRTSKLKLPTLGKEAAKKRLKAFCSTQMTKHIKSPIDSSLTDVDSIKKEEPKKKKTPKKSVIEQIKEDETRLKEVLVMHNCHAKYLGTGLAHLHDLMDNPNFLQNFEKKGLAIKNQINTNQLKELDDKRLRENSEDRSSYRAKKQKFEKEKKCEREKRNETKKSEKEKKAEKEKKDKKSDKQKKSEKDRNVEKQKMSGKKNSKVKAKSWKQLKSLNLSIYQMLSNEESDIDNSPFKSEKRDSYEKLHRFSPLDDKIWMALSMHKPLESVRINKFSGYGKKEYPGSMMRTTVTKPHITFSRNSGKIVRHYMNRSEAKFRNEHSKRIWSYMKKIIQDNPSVNEYKFSTFQNWYPTDWLNEANKDSTDENLHMASDTALAELGKKYEHSDMSCNDDNLEDVHNDSDKTVSETEYIVTNIFHKPDQSPNHEIVQEDSKGYEKLDSTVPQNSVEDEIFEDNSTSDSISQSASDHSLDTFSLQNDQQVKDISPSIGEIYQCPEDQHKQISPTSTEMINDNTFNELNLKDIKALILSGTVSKKEKKKLKEVKRCLKKAKKEKKKLKRERKRIRREKKKQKKLEKKMALTDNEMQNVESIDTEQDMQPVNSIDTNLEINPPVHLMDTEKELHHVDLIDTKKEIHDEDLMDTEKEMHPVDLIDTKKEIQPVDLIDTKKEIHPVDLIDTKKEIHPVESTDTNQETPPEEKPLADEIYKPEKSQYNDNYSRQNRPINTDRYSPTSSPFYFSENSESSPNDSFSFDSIAPRIEHSNLTTIIPINDSPPCKKTLTASDNIEAVPKVDKSATGNSLPITSTENIDLSSIPSPPSTSLQGGCCQIKPSPPSMSLADSGSQIKPSIVPVSIPVTGISTPTPVPPVNLQYIQDIASNLRKEVSQLATKEPSLSMHKDDLNAKPVAFRLSLTKTPTAKLSKPSPAGLFQEDTDEQSKEDRKLGKPGRLHFDKDFARVGEQELSLYGRVNDIPNKNMLETNSSNQERLETNSSNQERYSPSQIDDDNQTNLAPVEKSASEPMIQTESKDPAPDNSHERHSRRSRHSRSTSRERKKYSMSPKRYKGRSRSRSPRRRDSYSSSRSRKVAPRYKRSRSRSPRRTGSHYREERRPSKSSYNKRSRSPSPKRGYYGRHEDSENRSSPPHATPPSKPIPSIGSMRIESLAESGNSYNISHIEEPTDNSIYESEHHYQEDSSYATLDSPKRPSLMDRLRTEHGLNLEDDTSANIDNSNNSFDTVSQESQPNYWDSQQIEQAGGTNRVIRVGNVLQILPQVLPSEEPIKKPVEQQYMAQTDTTKASQIHSHSIVPLSPSFSPPSEDRALSPLPPPSPIKTESKETPQLPAAPVTPTITGPIPGLSSEALISAVAAASAASNVPFAQLISVLQEQQLLPKSVPLTEPEKAVKTATPQTPTEENKLDIEALKKASKERKFRKKQEKDRRRQERKKKKEEELAKQIALNQAEKDNEEALIKEAISAVPDMDGPVPDYYLMDDETDEIPVVHRSLSLPPPEKGILVLPTYKDDPCHQQKNVLFADGVIPGDGTSASGGDDDDTSTPTKQTKMIKRKRKKDLPSKKKAKTREIKLFDTTGDGICSPPPPPLEPPPSNAIKLYPGWSRCTYTEDETVILYTQLLNPASQAMQEAPVMTPDVVLNQSTGLMTAES